MPKRYNYDIIDPANTVKAAMQNAKVSFKKTRETCSTLRGRTVEGCIAYLKKVMLKKECVPFRRYSYGVHATPQARAFDGRVPCIKGRWPVKSCETIIKLLKNVKDNAAQKNLDAGELVIKMISVNRAPIIHGRCYRAHGRVNAFNKSPCHIQIVCGKKEQEVPVDASIVEIKE
ncbi:60S ribosomal protein L17 [Glugoides intestinalis]